MDIILTIILFIFVLGILVIAHEFGHFIASKSGGVHVDEFGVGFPPRLLSKIIHGTRYSINLLPFGGFVKIKGIGGDGDQTKTVENDSFPAQSFLRKCMILLAGIMMNVLLAVFFFTITFAAGFQAPIDALPLGGKIISQKIIISSLLPDGPAANADIQPGDAIVRINNEPITTVAIAQENIRSHRDEILHLTLQRDRKEVDIDVMPTDITSGDQSFIGIGVGLMEVATTRYGILSSVRLGATTTLSVTTKILQSFAGIIGDLVRTQTITEDVAGPVGIAVLTREVTQQGIIPLMQFAALLSLNLAIFNLLPLPALDGGRLLFVVLEKLRGKPVHQTVESVIHNIGFLLLLLFIAIVTFNDIRHF